MSVDSAIDIIRSRGYSCCMDFLGKQRRRSAALLGALVCLAACRSEPKNITESRAEFLAGKVMESYCSEGIKDGKCTDYRLTGQVPPADPRFKWAFKYLSEYTVPKRIMVVLVSGKGETSVTLEDVPVRADGTDLGAAAPPAPEPAQGEGR